MPKQSSKSGKRQKRDDDNDSDESADDDIQPIHFFVPGENINAAVLVEYINRYVDRTAKITSAQHPTVRLSGCGILNWSWLTISG
ncbi:hypothetical protein A1O7_05889 [Cladophialophora yegresii CBS 114405]|uniref:Uncharacterized protein n=1 Tax=Cladophialophora yegresii CBS 114405 TaxID=1182544 RepID=W9WIY8_9EURO|nr:uncharacterized protein A1O7_05889 [Cladophialophora yegresii CBS 114405]EXJ58464.1 hypothetical protein A1O7_05889 [Cladophialophora yegresii CBS 114405]